MGWFIVIMVVLIVICGCMFRLRCFTAYTCNVDDAHKQYKKWKELYEESTHNKIELIDVEDHGYYVTFYYKIKKEYR